MRQRYVLWLIAATAWIWVTVRLVAGGLAGNHFGLVFWLALTVVMVVATLREFKRRVEHTQQ